MKLLIETFVSLFLLSVATLVCGQMIGSQLQINEAKDFHAACVGLIETSNFEPSVMESCNQKPPGEDMSFWWKLQIGRDSCVRTAIPSFQQK